MAQDQQMAKQRLVYSILKFLEKEIQAEAENGERRESIEGKSTSVEEKKKINRWTIFFFSRCSMSGDIVQCFIGQSTE